MGKFSVLSLPWSARKRSSRPSSPEKPITNSYFSERNFGRSAAPEVIPVPLLPSGPGGVRGTSLHRARSYTLRHSRLCSARAEKILAQRLQPSQNARPRVLTFLSGRFLIVRELLARGSGFRFRGRCCRRIRWLHVGGIHPVHFERS